MKPNPFLVARQPQAKVRGNIVRSSAQKPRPVAVANGDAFAFIVDRIARADLVLRGAVYENESPSTFLRFSCPDDTKTIECDGCCAGNRAWCA